MFTCDEFVLIIPPRKPNIECPAGPSSLVAIQAIAWATSPNQTTVARAIAAAIATALRTVAAAIANKYVMRNIDQSNGEKAFRISPTSFNITLLVGKQLGMVGQKCICVMLVPGSWFLFNILNTNL